MVANKEGHVGLWGKDGQGLVRRGREVVHVDGRGEG